MEVILVITILGCIWVFYLLWSKMPEVRKVEKAEEIEPKEVLSDTDNINTKGAIMKVLAFILSVVITFVIWSIPAGLILSATTGNPIRLILLPILLYVFLYGIKSYLYFLY